MKLARHLAAILALPVMAVVVVPRALLRWASASDTRWLLEWPAILAPWTAGAVLGLAGFALAAWCVSLFARVGRGTLAPWDPTQRMVAIGPYRHVRNPMISGVLTMLLAEGLVLGSWVLLLWAVAFWLINHGYFQLSEEPGLERRFGESYRRYREHVPRWIPRRTPWTDSSADGTR